MPHEGYASIDRNIYIGCSSKWMHSLSKWKAFAEYVKALKVKNGSELKK